MSITESIVKIINMLSDIGFSPLNIVLITMLYFIGANSGIFPRFWKTKNGKENAPTIADLHTEISQLKGYFNHETTERLDEIKQTQKETLNNVTYLARKHDEYEKFGIKVRKHT